MPQTTVGDKSEAPASVRGAAEHPPRVQCSFNEWETSHCSDIAATPEGAKKGNEVCSSLNDKGSEQHSS